LGYPKRAEARAFAAFTGAFRKYTGMENMKQAQARFLRV